MLRNTDNIYSLQDTPATALDALRADRKHHRFLLATYQAPRHEHNAIHLIEYDESYTPTSSSAASTTASGKYPRKVNQLQIFKHPAGWLHHLASHPADPSLLFTIYSNPSIERAGALYRLPAPQTPPQDAKAEDPKPAQDLELLAKLPTKYQLRNIVWDEADEPQVSFQGLEDDPAAAAASPPQPPVAIMKLTATDLGGFSYWDVEGDLLKGKEEPLLRIDAVPSPTWKQYVQKALRDPNQKHLVSCAVEGRVSSYDLRSGKEAYRIAPAHSSRILDMDYNPNKPYNLVTAGQDCTVKFWDVRKERTPLKVLRDFTHWVSSVRFNPSHDQLVVTGSTSTTVKLWRVLSVSSAALTYDLTATAPSSGGGSYDISEKDVLVASYEHEDSIYQTAWSASDAWVFASLSYNGNVLISTVPNNQKFMILL